jgi:kinesin family protein 2/24
VSFFEIYGGRLFDLLNHRGQLLLMEDANQKIQVQGLEEKICNNPEEMFKIIEYGHTVRTTCATTSNDTSSRSHAICQIVIRTTDQKHVGKFLLVDLAVL